MTLQELAMLASTRNAYLVIRLNPFTIVCCSGVLGERMRVAETLKELYWKLPSLSLKRALESWQTLEPRVNACISRLVELFPSQFESQVSFTQEGELPSIMMEAQAQEQAQQVLIPRKRTITSCSNCYRRKQKVSLAHFRLLPVLSDGRRQT